jgi:hypothetical protein
LRQKERKNRVNINNGEFIERGRMHEREREREEGEVKDCAQIRESSVRVKN